LKKIFDFILKRYQIFIATFILLTAFIISRLPFFIYLPIVGFHPDTPDYFMPVVVINNGLLPKFGLLPPLYPLFLYFIGYLSNNILSVVIVQNLISFTVSLFYIAVIYKIKKNLTVWASLSFFVFFMSSYSIAFDTMLTTESIYASSLILIAALSLLSLNYKNKYIWISFSLALILPFLIRPNGFVIFFLLFLFILFMYVNDYPRRLYVYLIVPLVIVLVLGVIYNYITLSQPIPDRIMTYLPFTEKKDKYQMSLDNYQGKEKPFSKEKIKAISDSIYGYIAEASRRQVESGEIKLYKNKFLKFLIFFNAISYDSRTFYYAELNRRYNDFYINDYIKNTNWNEFNVVFISENFKKLMFKNYYDNLPPINFYQNADFKNTNSKINKSYLLKAYTLYYNYLFMYFFRTKFFILTLSIIFIFSLIRFYQSRFKDINSFYVFFLIAILASTALFFTLTGFNTGSWRYVYPTEFIYYLVPVFIPFLFNFKKKKNSHAQQ